MIHIKPAIQTDWPQIISIAEAAKTTLEYPAAFNWSAETLAEELNHVFTILAEQSEEVRGFVCYRELSEAFEISVLATHPSFQRTGIQTELVLYLQKLAATHNKNVWLEVHQKNTAALGFYQKLGFQTLRIRSHYYSDGGGAVVMGWKASENR
ncbi:GNAT family N-acetyltransferase [Pseudobdellovibrio exovorus]|uniref:Putative peptide N-acetyltransferase n=1 Tax=Pseudobdellovibrio exovorus JSS TaxID=1184267 RepID=M4VCK8_9BACT|nr:GNAT family N-acetyltransferase [Pseudobdellovibrio exovorus]AGH95771.1 putative peptide N-acetyltransferase [Pseudobdellovibrio exovorus JSS]